MCDSTVQNAHRFDFETKTRKQLGHVLILLCRIVLNKPNSLVIGEEHPESGVYLRLKSEFDTMSNRLFL